LDAPTFHPDVNSLFLLFPHIKGEIEAFVVEMTMFGDGDTVLSPRFSGLWCSSGVSTRKVHAGIINLGEYLFIGLGGKHVCELMFEGWSIYIQPVPKTLQFPPHVQSPEYHFDHHLCMVRTDGSQFSAEDAEKRIHRLCSFLSFCRGGWVSTALATGLDDSGELAVAEWGTGQVSAASASISGWLDKIQGGEMSILYPAFCTRMADESFAETFGIVLYWYIRSDTNNVGPDGGLILLQTALERIAWHVLVHERHALNAEGFGRLTASDQLRLLLTMLSIPTQIPVQLEAISALGRSNAADGPQCLTLIRNSLVHPPRKPPGHKTYPYYEAYTLAKWYLELILLRSFGYDGKYSNRTNRRWTGELEPVPWAKG
jgi:hypothetical protein